MSTETNGTRQARNAPMILGLILIGLGATAALAAQTPLSLGQAASIAVLVCSMTLLSFLLNRSRSTAPNSLS